MGQFLRHQLIDGFPINRLVGHLYFLLKSLLILIKQDVKRILIVVRNIESYSWKVKLQWKNLPCKSFPLFEVKITPSLILTTSIHKNVIEVIAVLFQVIFTRCGIIWWQFSSYFGIENSFTSIICIFSFSGLFI